MLQYRLYDGKALPAGLQGFIKAAANIGSVVGQFGFGYAADALGRKAVCALFGLNHTHPTNCYAQTEKSSCSSSLPPSCASLTPPVRPPIPPIPPSISPYHH